MVIASRKFSTIGLAVYGRDFIQLGSDASRVTASIEPLASLIRLSIISSLQGSLANGAADLLSEIRYSSLSIISYLFGEGAVASSAPIPS